MLVRNLTASVLLVTNLSAMESPTILSAMESPTMRTLRKADSFQGFRQGIMRTPTEQSWIHLDTRNGLISGVSVENTTGFIDGEVKSASVVDQEGLFLVKMKIQDQDFESLVQEPEACGTLILNGCVDPENQIAFNYERTIASQMTATQFHKFLETACGLKTTTPLKFLSKSQYTGNLRIACEGELARGRYALSYSSEDQGMGKFKISNGQECFTHEIAISEKFNRKLIFPNGIHLRLDGFDGRNKHFQAIFTILQG